MNKLKIICASFAIFLAGCSTTGIMVSHDTALQFKEGVSTEADIVTRLGKPSNITVADGIKTISYVGTDITIHPETFIPFVGLFAGGSDYTIQTTSFQIGKNGILERINYTNSNGTTRMGGSTIRK